MKDIKCTQCNKLLLKGEFTGVIQIKCPKCKHTNEYNQ